MSFLQSCTTRMEILNTIALVLMRIKTMMITFTTLVLRNLLMSDIFEIKLVGSQNRIVQKKKAQMTSRILSEIFMIFPTQM